MQDASKISKAFLPRDIKIHYILDTRSRVSWSFTNNSRGIYDMISKIAMYDAWYASSVYKCIGQIDMNAVCRYLT